MDSAENIVKHTLESPFEKEKYEYFIKNLLNNYQGKTFTYRGKTIPLAYREYIKSFQRIGKYQDPNKKKIDLLIVNLKKATSLDRARSIQRKFLAWYLNGSRGGIFKDAALVAFAPPQKDTWRFSLVKMEYRLGKTKKGKIKAEEELTPAKRFSFLVGRNENSYTAKSRLTPILKDNSNNPTLDDLEEAFSVEKVTKEFFEKYRGLFLQLKESLDGIIKNNNEVKANFKKKGVNTADFTKKLLGQIVFLYFLQKKGWFGVKRGQKWGLGSKDFLRELFNKEHSDYNNFFNEILEPLFYEALRLERPGDYYFQFDCRIPFLNGGLFDPINNYDWADTDIIIPNQLFSNKQKTKEGDIGTGVLDIFDRYNFTVKEDEPLEKEVAVDPEMLGKVFENLLEVKDRKSKGTYYTPREIVHYMCQESLINYLITESELDEEKIRSLIKPKALTKKEFKKFRQNGGKKKQLVEGTVLALFEGDAKKLDKLLKNIRICDPAVGSGAFLVGMLHEIVNARKRLSFILNKKVSEYQFKRETIQDCLYGVDIDPGAIEIAKLRLWLSLIVDEEHRKTIQALPNLDYKIVCGNSLLSVEKNLFNQQLFKKMEELKPLYFNETSTRKKQKYKKQIDKLISQITNSHKDFDFEIYFSEIFHEKKGFDVVIANPPYIDYRKIEKNTKKVISKYRVAGHSKMINLYLYFFERGLELLSPNGILSFISPQQYLILDNCKGIRDIIRENSVIILADFARVKVFDASTYTFVSIIQKIKHRDSGTYYEFNQISDLSNNIRNLRIPNPITEPVCVSSYVQIIKKIENNATLVLGGLAEIFCASSSESIRSDNLTDSNKPYVIARDIKPWVIDKPKQYVDVNTYGNKSASKQSGSIIYTSRMTKLIRAAYIKKNDKLGGKVNVIKVKKSVNPLFITALLNSKLINFWHKEKFSMEHFQGGALPINTTELKKIPVSINKQFIDKIISIAKQIIKNEVNNKQGQSKIDQLVYKLYGFTKKEIKIVEGDKALSEK